MLRPTARAWVLPWLALIALAGCTPPPDRSAASAPAAASAAPKPLPAKPAATAPDNEPFRVHSLTLYGYNYTDTAIGSFEVNGHGGGDVVVSGPTSGGGKSACCVPVYGPVSRRKYEVKWTRDGDTWCVQQVTLHGRVPPDAEYLEVHFYRDGHIELAATPMPSPPRLKLQYDHYGSRHADVRLNVNHDTAHSRCKLGYRP